MSELLNYLLNNEPQFRRARLAALYSDFRQQQTLNPDGYQANIEAWQKALANAARAGVMPSHGSTPDLLILKADDELLRALNTNEWGRPLSLGTVIQEAIAKKELMPLGEFMNASDSIYARCGHGCFSEVPHSKSLTITQEDTSIASLKSLIADLEIQTKLFAERVERMEGAAKEAVAKKNRVSALAALRSKKSAESNLANRHATLSQLEEVLSKIEQAADQVDLVRIMESSTKVLSSLNKEVGGVERVDDVVDKLREQMGQVDEVGDIIAEPGQNNVDETEVDDELEAMEREETRKIEEKQRLVKEEKERREAADTKRKLDELEDVERKAREAKKDEDFVDESTKGLRRISLEPEPIAEHA
ncbi:hypothetical protein EYC80_001530 [Monilinia laxa]|uniref:SNF7 family protein n=1 Tax=Monilinia laxa TaxID=61186 RepID=A0A5N6K552_MONLA|nr:hypothetical protein EYC80_001530 [Monilinia laxa]